MQLLSISFFVGFPDAVFLRCEETLIGGLELPDFDFLERGGGSHSKGGEIRNFIGTTTVTNSIVANSPSGGDLAGTFSGSNNLIEDGSGGLAGTITGDPLLGPLADNGGPTLTHALLPGSPALDAGTSTESTDQRGLTRPVDLLGFANTGDANDIGAYEAQVAPTADFDASFLVTGADFLTWQRGFGTTVGATRVDGNSDVDVDVDASDLAAWGNPIGLGETSPRLSWQLKAKGDERGILQVVYQYRFAYRNNLPVR